MIQDNQIYDRVRERYNHAVDALGISYYLYRAKTMGKACSCIREEAQSKTPKNLCPVCYGIGLVGGYEQYGCEKYTLEPTDKLLMLNNVKLLGTSPDGQDIRPTVAQLVGSQYGKIETAPIYINQATGYKGYEMNWYTSKKYGSTCTAYFLPSGEVTWRSLDTFGDYLDDNPTFEMKLKVEFQNVSPNYSVPLTFQVLHLKWQRTTDTIKIEQSKYMDKSKMLLDSGFVDETTGITYTMSYTPTTSTRDFMERVSDGKRFKITDRSVVAPGDNLIHQTMSMRVIQESEILNRVF